MSQRIFFFMEHYFGLFKVSRHGNRYWFRPVIVSVRVKLKIYASRSEPQVFLRYTLIQKNEIGNIYDKFLSVSERTDCTSAPALVDARFESCSLGLETLSTTLLEKERCKIQGPPFVSSSFRAHSWAYLVWARPGLLSSASRGIAWKRSLYLDPFPLPHKHQSLPMT